MAHNGAPLHGRCVQQHNVMCTHNFFNNDHYKEQMPSNEKIVIAILVITILSLSVYTYTAHMATQTARMADVKRREADEAALVAEVKRREAAETALAKAETYIVYITNSIDAALRRSDFNEQAKLTIGNILSAARPLDWRR